MRSDDLESVALTLVAEGKGILAADEQVRVSAEEEELAEILLAHVDAS